MPNAATDWLRERAADIRQCLSPLCKDVHDYALLDWPVHSNVGDSAIWLGELAFFMPVLGRSPAYVTASNERAERLDHYCPEGPVFLCGGGNFGDIWPDMHENRLHLLQTAPHRRIIQLPQSIHFSSDAELQRTRRIIAGHPDFILLVRDTASFDLARRHFDCDVRLCPDMALMLGPLPRPALPVHDVFCLMRMDKERAFEGNLAVPGPVDDWILDEPPPETTTEKIVRRLYWKSLSPRAPGLMKSVMMQRHIAVLNRYAQQHMDRGLAMLSQGRSVVTDRLHGHLLCVLLGIPHVVLDNSYGKIANFQQTWPADGLTCQVSAPEHVAEALAQLGASPGKAV